jgi:hypothetical protein
MCEQGTVHTNPKRKQGKNKDRPSLARFDVARFCEQHGNGGEKSREIRIAEY